MVCGAVRNLVFFKLFPDFAGHARLFGLRDGGAEADTSLRASVWQVKFVLGSVSVYLGIYL